MNDPHVRIGERAGPRGATLGRLVWTAAAVAVVLLASGASSVQGDGPVAIEIVDSMYAPPDLTIAPGTTVRWINRDEETHTVTSTTELFKSGGLNLGDEYTHTFATPGVYPYTCALHDFMQGTITVK